MCTCACGGRALTRAPPAARGHCWARWQVFNLHREQSRAGAAALALVVRAATLRAVAITRMQLR
jgi:hypothetical protein